MKRWKEYFEQLLNEENNRLIREVRQVNIGMVMRFSGQEVLNALKKMKNGKATGPDMIPVEAWKALGDEGVDILYDLMIKILTTYYLLLTSCLGCPRSLSGRQF